MGVVAAWSRYAEIAWTVLVSGIGTGSGPAAPLIAAPLFAALAFDMMAPA
jgi:hypothetical protein